jgi:hypothetical protein
MKKQKEGLYIPLCILGCIKDGEVNCPAESFTEKAFRIDNKGVKHDVGGRVCGWVGNSDEGECDYLKFVYIEE